MAFDFFQEKKVISDSPTLEMCRKATSNIKGTCYAAMNTDVQVLNDCSAEQKIQLGKKLTNGFGAGASSDIGEAAAKESE